MRLRSHGATNRWWRLPKDYHYECLPEVALAMVTLAMIRLMLRRLADLGCKRVSTPHLGSHPQLFELGQAPELVL